MTYGWAILVVLIAIGALAYFGILNPKNYTSEPIYSGEFICNSLNDRKSELREDLNSDYIFKTGIESNEIYVINEITYDSQTEDYTYCKIDYDLCIIKFEDDDNSLYSCRKIEDYILMGFNYDDWLKWYKEDNN